jgi:hypothetical protein
MPDSVLSRPFYVLTRRALAGTRLSIDLVKSENRL